MIHTESDDFIQYINTEVEAINNKKKDKEEDLTRKIKEEFKHNFIKKF